MNKISHIKSLNPFAGISYSGFVSYCVPIRNIADYSPFGVQLDGRTITMDSYRYAFNGMEADNEVKGQGNSYTTEFRQYDARLGRWLSLDPLMAKFPWQSPYVAFDNIPTVLKDPTGLASEGGPDPIPSYIYMQYKFNTASGKWNINGWHMQNSWDFKFKMTVVAAYSMGMSSKIKAELNLSDYSGKNDIEWMENNGSEAPQVGYALNLNYKTSKNNNVKVSFFTFQFENLLGEGFDLYSVSNESQKSEYTNCFSHSLGMYGYINTTKDFETILNDDYVPVNNVNDIKEGTIAYSQKSEHAMKVVKRDGNKLTYESTWNGYGETNVGTYDELKEKMFDYINPSMKENEFKFYNKKSDEK